MQETIDQFEMLSIMLSPDFDKSEWEFSWGIYLHWFPICHFESKKEIINEYAQNTIKFRKIKKTQVIKGFTVPAPIKDWDELEVNSDYYFPAFYREKMVDYLKARKHQDSIDKLLFNRGLLFKTEKDAVAVAKAMLGIDPYK